MAPHATRVVPQAGDRDSTWESRGKSAIRAAALAFFVDAFDAYVPVLAIIPAQNYFVPESLSNVTRVTIDFVVFFTISWVGRPIGSFIFGHLADTVGRRLSTLISIAGFGIVTLLMALLPGYATLGLGAVVAFGVLRLIGGIFIGGEYAGAATLALEYAPREKRGLWGSLCNIGYPSALAANTLIVYLLLLVIPSGHADSAYSVWGWRIPFFIGVGLAAWTFASYYFSVEESDLWLGVTKVAVPAKKLFTERQYVLRFLQVCVVMLGAWLTLNAVAGSLPSIMKNIIKIENGHATLFYFGSTAISAALFPLIGILGQKFGRRNLYIFLGVINVVVTPPVYIWLIGAEHDSNLLFFLAVFIIQLPTLAVWAVVTAYITESFPTAVRSTAYGLGFSLTTVPAAFYSFFMIAISGMVPYKYTIVVVLALGGILLGVGAYIGKDNRLVDFHRAEEVS